MSNKEKTQTASGGIGFSGLLTIAFIVLKLTGVITWGWEWVLAPLWIPIVLVIIILLLVLGVPILIMLIRTLIKEIKYKYAQRSKNK